MNKILLIVILLFGCSSPSHLNVKFKIGDKVITKNGFYKECHGMIDELIIERSFIYYVVRFSCKLSESTTSYPTVVLLENSLLPYKEEQ